MKCGFPERDFSVLTPRQLDMICKRAQPRVIQKGLTPEQEAAKLKHENTVNLISHWNNTVKRNRIEMLTRLQKEKEAEAERLKELDKQLDKFNKLKRQADLATARKKSFQERPEIRALNSQLLLAECLEENNQIQKFKTRKKIREMQRQMQEDEEAERLYKEACEKEERIKEERKQKAKLVALGFRKQREDQIIRREKEREEDLEDDRVLLEQCEYQNELERQKQIQLREERKKHLDEMVSENSAMIEFKKRYKELEKREDERLLQLRIKTLDEEDERREFERKQRFEKVEAQNKLIEAEAQRQIATRKQQEDFLDKQLADQYAKDSKRIKEMTDKRERLEQERRQDMLTAMRIQNHRFRKRNQKRIFPDDHANKFEDEMNQRELLRIQNMKDIAMFQLQQAREKKDRENAEREREKLETMELIKKDQEDMALAQEYAKILLEKQKQLDEEECLTSRKL